MKKLALIAIAALMLVGFGPISHSFAQSKVVRVTLIDENGSGEDGSAQLTDQGDGTTKVELIMLNAPDGAVQPAAVQKGTCANLDADTAFALGSVTASKSTTSVKSTLADLMKDKYALVVYKSDAEKVVISCGNLPQAATTSGPMTLEQVFTTLLDNANELLGTVKKHEADASQNAYDAYHTTFAAHEDEVKAKDAGAQTELEDAMHGIRDALTGSDWSKSEAAAQELVDTIKNVQSELLGSASSSQTSSTGTMGAAMKSLQAAAARVQTEVKNKDMDGSTVAYDEFHTVFAANENDIKAKNAEAQANIETAMHEVRDALAVGDFTKAGTAADELVGEVNDATKELAALDLPQSGNGDLLVIALVLAAFALTLTFAGARLRRIV